MVNDIAVWVVVFIELSQSLGSYAERAVLNNFFKVLKLFRRVQQKVTFLESFSKRSRDSPKWPLV